MTEFPSQLEIHQWSHRNQVYPRSIHPWPRVQCFDVSFGLCGEIPLSLWWHMGGLHWNHWNHWNLDSKPKHLLDFACIATRCCKVRLHHGVFKQQNRLCFSWQFPWVFPCESWTSLSCPVSDWAFRSSWRRQLVWGATQVQDTGSPDEMFCPFDELSPW